jgi:hypothetical protein
MKRLKILTFLTLAVIFFTACSDKNWGIDGASIPKCSSNDADSSSAKLIPKGSRIIPTQDGTTLRIWHFSNGDKMVCTLTGNAVIDSYKNN